MLACVGEQIVGWGGLGVHYDKETELESGQFAASRQPEVPPPLPPRLSWAPVVPAGAAALGASPCSISRDPTASPCYISRDPPSAPRECGSGPARAGRRTASVDGCARA